MEDEAAEIHFCESRQLNMSTLRMTSEAKVRLAILPNKSDLVPILSVVILLLFFLPFPQLQLKDLLCNAGFPDGM